MTDRETFRLAPPVIFWWVWLAFVAANAADYAVQGLPSARFGAVVGAILLLVTGVAYTLALRPRVYSSGAGITVLNPYRTHFVPWTLITAVVAGEWVEIHYSPDAAAPPSSGAGRKTLHCWALYVSSRARRKLARPPQRAGDPLTRGLPGLLGLGRGGGLSGLGGDGSATGYASPRLPAEARYLASLPPAKAMAVRLDTRADRERARAAGRVPAGAASPPRATAGWSWAALAAVAVPALILAAVAAS